MLVPAIYLTIVHALSVGSLRYRLPADPALALLAAAGWMRIVETRTGPTDPENRYKHAPSSFDASNRTAHELNTNKEHG